MNVGVRLPDHKEVDDLEFSHRAETDWEYESVWAGELWGSDIFIRLSHIAAYTSSIGLGVGIANIFSRSPAVLAMAGVTLDEISGGRVHFGVGPGTEKTIEDLHGLEFERPIRRTHECIEIIRQYTNGSDATPSFDGEIFDVADFPALDGDFPILNAALGPGNRRVTGRLCDGWLPHNVPLANLPALFEEIESAAEGAGRNPDDIEVRPFLPVAVDADPEVAYDTLRKHIAYYVGSSSGYENALAGEFGDTIDDIAHMWRAGDHDKASTQVTRTMVDGIGIASTPDVARAELERLLNRSIIDAVVLVVPLQADPDLIWTTFDELSPITVGSET